MEIKCSVCICCIRFLFEFLKEEFVVIILDGIVR